MDDFDDRVIPYEEALRRRRAVEEAQRRGGTIHEVKMSDALDHLLEEGESPGKEGSSPDALRRIVEREFADEPQPGGRPEARPRPRLVEQPEDEPMGLLCSFETRTCEDPADARKDPPER